MKPAEFLEPETLEEAFSLLSKYKEEAKLVASGQSLIPMLQQRLITPKYLISTKSLPGLDYIKEDDDALRIGALTTQRTIETSEVVRRRSPLRFPAVPVSDSSMSGQKAESETASTCWHAIDAASSARFVEAIALK